MLPTAQRRPGSTVGESEPGTWMTAEPDAAACDPNPPLEYGHGNAAICFGRHVGLAGGLGIPAMLNGCGAAIGLWLRRIDPALLAERMKSPFSADQRPRDRAIMGAIVMLFCIWLVLCGLDRRVQWSDV